jgi:hypothetical protein
MRSFPIQRGKKSQGRTIAAGKKSRKTTGSEPYARLYQKKPGTGAGAEGQLQWKRNAI